MRPYCTRLSPESQWYFLRTRPVLPDFTLPFTAAPCGSQRAGRAWREVRVAHFVAQRTPFLTRALRFARWGGLGRQAPWSSGVGESEGVGRSVARKHCRTPGLPDSAASRPSRLQGAGSLLSSRQHPADAGRRTTGAGGGRRAPPRLGRSGGAGPAGDRHPGSLEHAFRYVSSISSLPHLVNS